MVHFASTVVSVSIGKNRYKFPTKKSVKDVLRLGSLKPKNFSDKSFDAMQKIITREGIFEIDIAKIFKEKIMNKSGKA